MPVITKLTITSTTFLSAPHRIIYNLAIGSRLQKI